MRLQGHPGELVSPTGKQGVCELPFQLCTVVQGKSGVHCPPQHLGPMWPGHRPVLRGLEGAQRPSGSRPSADRSPASSTPALARISCSAAQLPAASELPGARKAGIRCYHNKLNCSQQGSGK